MDDDDEQQKFRKADENEHGGEQCEIAQERKKVAAAKTKGGRAGV